jgi:hypothetical protein
VPEVGYGTAESASYIDFRDVMTTEADALRYAFDAGVS